MSEPIRIQKILAASGVASRRGAEEMILAGRVAVNGKPVRLGDRADPLKDSVTLDGKPLRRGGPLIYLMLHKPRGYITTMHDEMERKCVAELVRGVPGRVFPIGRLDRESEGLLLMTNDGEFANAMMHLPAMCRRHTALPSARPSRENSFRKWKRAWKSTAAGRLRPK